MKDASTGENTQVDYKYSGDYVLRLHPTPYTHPYTHPYNPPLNPPLEPTRESTPTTHPYPPLPPTPTTHTPSPTVYPPLQTPLTTHTYPPLLPPPPCPSTKVTISASARSSRTRRAMRPYSRAHTRQRSRCHTPP